MAERHGWADIGPIWAENPQRAADPENAEAYPPKARLGLLISLGLDLCDE